MFCSTMGLAYRRNFVLQYWDWFIDDIFFLQYWPWLIDEIFVLQYWAWLIDEIWIILSS